MREKMSNNQAGAIDKKGGIYWDMWGIRLFGRGEKEVLRMAAESRDKGELPFWIATVNPEFVMATFAEGTAAKTAKRTEFYELLKKTDVNVMDGVGLIWAKKVLSIKYQVSGIRILVRMAVGLKVGVEILLGMHRENLVTGADLMERMCEEAGKRGRKVYLLGGWGQRAKKTAEYLGSKYGISDIRYSEGKPKVTDEEVIREINAFEPDYLFVALGMKKQEEWIERHLDKLNVKVVMGVGRSFDYYSGELPRAPERLRRMGLEWLYSLWRQPERWKRQLVLPRFVWKVIFD